MVFTPLKHEGDAGVEDENPNTAESQSTDTVDYWRMAGSKSPEGMEDMGSLAS